MTDYPKLKMETKETHYVDWYDLAELLKVVYETDSFDLGSGNDSTYSNTVDPDELDDYDRESIVKMVKHKFIEDYQLGTVLNDLCDKGAIKPGHYNILISW